MSKYDGENLTCEEFEKYEEDYTEYTVEEIYEYAHDRGKEAALTESQSKKVAKTLKINVYFHKALKPFLGIVSAAGGILAFMFGSWYEVVFCAVLFSLFSYLSVFKRRDFNGIIKQIERNYSSFIENSYEAYTVNITEKVYSKSFSKGKRFLIVCGKIGVKTDEDSYKKADSQMIFVFVFVDGKVTDYRFLPA